jgi:glucose/arabinose dehydrogenase
VRFAALVFVSLLLTFGLTAPAGAKSGHGNGGGDGPDVDVVADELDNPRHVAVAPNGDVYVAESGRGGDHETAASCFESPEGDACTGDSGAVTRISKRGWRTQQERVVTGLASFAPISGDDAIGPHGIFVKGGNLYVTNGGPTAPTRDGEPVLRDPTLVAEDPISALYGTLLKVRKHGRVSEIADLWAFENENNPDEEVGNPAVDSNPVDVLAGHRGRLYVADAGGNTILRVSRGGAVRVLSLFPNIPMPDPGGGDDIDMNAVPTGVVAGSDGALYVSQLTGFPFPIGGAQIFRVDPRSGDYTTYATGFTNVIDLDFGRDGTLYVLEIDSDSILPPDGPKEGGLWAVPRGGGTPEKVALPAGTLTEPGGIAVGKHGDLYVSNHGREAGDGEVLKIDLD